jgi:hypothetical protein
VKAPAPSPPPPPFPKTGVRRAAGTRVHIGRGDFEQRRDAAATSITEVRPSAWLTDVLERMVSGRTKAHELEHLLPWTWKAERVTAAVHA